MPRQASPTNSSGGDGFTFADKVAANFFTLMLAREFPIEHHLGLIDELHFENKESGRNLDDLHLRLKLGPRRCDGQYRSRATSI
jgi:hypothetical protein